MRLKRDYSQLFTYIFLTGDAVLIIPSFSKEKSASQLSSSMNWVGVPALFDPIF